MEEIFYEQYQPAYREEVAHLLQHCFDSSFTLERFRWKHEQNPFGESLGWVAKDRQGIIGCNFFLKTGFKVGSQSFMLLRSCESAVHERGRRKGIFSNIINQANEGTKSSGEFSGFFGTPNDQSSSGFRKLGWKFLPSIRYYYGLKATLPFGSSGDVRFIPASQFPSSVKCESQMPGIAKDARYYMWRYQQIVGDYQLALDEKSESFLIYRVGRKFGRKIIMVYEISGDANKMITAAMKHEGTMLMYSNLDMSVISTPLMNYQRGAIEFIYFALKVPEQDLGKIRLTLGDLDKIL